MSGIPSNTLVRVPGNWVPLSEIEIGDTVISADGSLTKVLAVYDTGMQPVYRFTFTDGRQCDTSADYVWDLEVRYFCRLRLGFRRICRDLQEER